MTNQEIIQAVIDRIAAVQHYDIEAVEEEPWGRGSGLHIVKATPDNKHGEWIRVSDIQAVIEDIRKFNA